MPYDDDPYADSPYDEIDPEGPSADDIARFDRDGSACPSCGSEIYDDAGVCPVCGELLTPDTAGAKPWVALVAGVVLLAFVLFYLLPLI